MNLFTLNRKKMISYLSALSISLLVPLSTTANSAYANDATPAPAAQNAAPSAAASGPAAATDMKLDAANLQSGIALEITKQCQALAGPHHPLVSAIVGKIEASCSKLVAADETCFGVFSNTNKWCHTEKNENIVSSIAAIQTVMSVAAGVANACSNFGKAMDIAKMAMASYTTACTAAQVVCSSKCSAAVTALKAFNGVLSAAQGEISGACATIASTQPPDAAGLADCKSVSSQIVGLIASAKKEVVPEAQPSSVATKAKICKVDVVAVLGTAVLNIAALAQSKAQSEQCKKDAAVAAASCDKPENKDTDACVKCEDPAYKDHAKCKTVAVIVCDQPENQDKPICICKANPRTKGCEGVSTAGAELGTLNNGGTAGASRTPSSNLVNAGTGPATGTDFSKYLKSNGTDGNTSGSGGGSFGSGSGAGISGGSSAADTGKTEAKSDANKLSANILDTSGGGGAGYRGSTYMSPEYKDKIKDYAKKNGIGKLAGNSWSDQVTGTGGRTNFEKVKARYQDNKPSLLNK